MDLESIERCWREQSEVLPPRLEAGSVMRMIGTRAIDIRRAVRRRLRREAGYYLPLMAASAATLLGGMTFSRVLAASTVVLLLGGVMATLWRAERRIEDAPLDLSLREALTGLLSQVEAAGRAYVTVYVALFALAAVALSGVVWWRHGLGSLLVGTAGAGAMAVTWSVRSGRGYVERMFRRYRGELVECLGQLDGQT